MDLLKNSRTRRIGSILRKIGCGSLYCRSFLFSGCNGTTIPFPLCGFYAVIFRDNPENIILPIRRKEQ